MSNKYHVLIGDKWIGPIGSPKLGELISSGRIVADTMVSLNGESAKSAAELLGDSWMKMQPHVTEPIPPPPPAFKKEEPYVASTQKITKFRETAYRRFKPANSLLDVFDFSLEKYVTPLILRFTWVVCFIIGLIMIGTYTIDFVVSLAPESDPVSVQRDSTYSPFGSSKTFSRIDERAIHFFYTAWRINCVVLGLLWVRVVLETVIVIFNIAKDVRSISDTRPG